MSDNHAYLLAYWCLALAISMAANNSQQVAAFNARYLIALVFLLASWQKWTTISFVDGSFFALLFLQDQRFEYFTQLFTSMTYSDIQDARAWLKADLPEDAPEDFVRFAFPVSLKYMSYFATWWSLLEQSAVAIAFLSPVGSWFYRRRDVFLWLFCITAYAFAPVPGFGWLLIAMALSQCESGAIRGIYLSCAALLAFYYYVPWASGLLSVFS